MAAEAAAGAVDLVQVVALLGAGVLAVPLFKRIGLGSILGNYLGAILIVALPVILGTLPGMLGIPLQSATVEHLNVMIVGATIILFLIVEPHGLARFWQIIREKLIMWPFPH